MPLKPILTSQLSRLLPAILLISVGEARADVIVYNSFGPGMTITPIGITGTFTIGPPGTSNFLSAPFSPSSTVDLTSLTGNWAGGLDSVFPLTTTSPITVSLWSGSNSEPITELQSWALTVDELATNYTLTSAVTTNLVAGNTYWVVADYTNGVDSENFLGWGSNPGATTGGLWQSDISATSLALVSGPQPALEVQGTLTATPEPSAFLLVSVGTLGLLITRRTTEVCRRRGSC